MRVLVVLLLLMPLLSGCETVKKGFDQITSAFEPDPPPPPPKPQPTRSAEK
jgi:hypothetical protein